MEMIKLSPCGHRDKMVSLRDNTDVEGSYLFGPMSEPSDSLNLTSIGSFPAISIQTIFLSVNSNQNKPPLYFNSKFDFTKGNSFSVNEILIEIQTKPYSNCAL